MVKGYGKGLSLTEGGAVIMFPGARRIRKLWK